MRIAAGVVAIASFIASMSLSTRAWASLEDDARAVEAAAAQAGATIDRARTEFVEEGHVLEIPLPSSKPCKTVVVLAARSISLSILVAAPGDDVDDALAELAAPISTRRQDAESGLFQLSVCGTDASGVDRVYVRMASPRATVEIRVASGAKPVEGLVERLGRAVGPAVPRGDPGPLLPVTPIADRRQRAEASARADGATSVSATETTANEGGIGDARLKAIAGCHRFTVMAEPTEGHAVMDLDAEIHDADAGTLLARDRGETPDARLDACVGRPTELNLVFAGAPPRARVVVLDAVTPLPAAIPEHYGDRARAAIAGSLKKRVRKLPAQGPIFETLGSQGAMTTSMPVEAGRCYLVALGLVRGSSRGIRLVAQASPRASTEEVPHGIDASSLVFCASTFGRARLYAEAPGSGIGWVLFVWLLGGAP